LNAVTKASARSLCTRWRRRRRRASDRSAMRNDSFDLEAILAAIDSRRASFFWQIPTNPTGTVLERRGGALCAQVPGHVVWCWMRLTTNLPSTFATLRAVSYSKSLDYVRQGASVVVLRTFFQSARTGRPARGLRSGPGGVCWDICARMRNTFSVSSVAQAAAVAALDDDKHLQRVVENQRHTVAGSSARDWSALGYGGGSTGCAIFCIAI